ncbi:MAG TPA: DUF1932 domain-containing protein [Gammaproteobacteria bacterium]|nr:DUF1932 domain-containing protein [Gammaproteobacteria bacterium]
MSDDREIIGFLHPGAMGVSLAATARNTGHAVYWSSAGRSEQSRARAARHGVVDAGSLEALCRICGIIVCVCPPHAAVEVAEQVQASGFRGIYADVNAISPQKAKHIGQLMSTAGADFVDGGIIGLPAWKPDTTWLYLSGQSAERVAACFDAGPLGVEVIGDDVGKASALKMCFAANTKGTTALLCAILAAAEQLGVRRELEAQWSRNGSDQARKTRERVRGVTAKAWRFSGEMEEIASTLDAAGLPAGFHLAAREVYERLSGFEEAGELPALEEVLATLIA